MRPGVLERLDLTYEVLSERNPRIILSHATGWGHLGPDGEAQLGSFDGLAQARGGLMSVNGRRETGPISVNMPIADQVGGMMGAFGMMVALWERERSGRGQEVNTSLYGSQIFMQAFGILGAIWNDRASQLRGADEARPHWASYPCADGKLLMMAGSQPDRWWAEFCDVMGVPECAEGVYTANSFNPDWCRQTRAKLVARFQTAPHDVWMKKLTPKFFVQPVASYTDIGRDPQAWANGYLAYMPREDGQPVPMVGTPVHLSRTPATMRNLAPELGQHTEEILLELGFDWQEIISLRERGAFGWPSPARSPQEA
jgi:crotonobetainyl-CoA:carnitine CoA-transferase CaiB-like acyl-CoA transferase